MDSIQLNLIPHETKDGSAYQHLQIILAGDGIIVPSDLKGLKLPPGIEWSQGVVLEGRGPIWLYGYLIHECHAAIWVGCYDPRLSGAVIVESHARSMSVGDIVKLDLPQ